MSGTRKRETPKARRERELYEEAMRQQHPPFGGRTYDPAVDGKRLGAQLARVFRVMEDGSWHTLGDLAHLTGDPEASISARLRDFRKAPFGGHRLEAERMPGKDGRRGLWRYRLNTDRGGIRA